MKNVKFMTFFLIAIAVGVGAWQRDMLLPYWNKLTGILKT